MITRSSLKKDIDCLRSIIAKLADFVEQHTEFHKEYDENIEQMYKCIRELDTKCCQIEAVYERFKSDTNTQIDKLWNSINTLDTYTHEVDSKLYLLECKTEFLEHNKDALEMWIECVRQTQHLYQESQKSEDTCEV